MSIFQLALSPANWLAFGIILGILELLISGSVLLGFGVGACIVSAALAIVGSEVFAGVSGLAYLGVLWAASSYVGWRFVRKLPGAQPETARIVRRDINDAPYKGDRD